ncbi:MAG: polysaccharide biosynthesis tyrosine autokinase [Rikenellaceae bacterium]
MQSNDFNDIITEESSNSLSIKDLIFLFLSKWYLFAISIVFAIGGAYVYLKITPPVYTRTAEILIKQDDKGGSISGMGATSELANLGLVSSNTNVVNEMRMLKSLTLATEVVSALKLNISYHAKTTWRDAVLYGSNNPISVKFDSSLDYGYTSFEITPVGGDQFQISTFKWSGDGSLNESEEIIFGKFGNELVTPVGNIVVSKSPFYATAGFESVIAVSQTSVYNIAKGYSGALGLELSDKTSSTVILTLVDQSPQRADDYINTLISVYNENWIKDKNQISVSTDKFIAERLAAISATLGDVDENISSFKSENMMPDLNIATSMYMQESNKLDADMMELTNQLSMSQYIRDYMVSDANKNMLLPANTGVEESNIESQISEYNNIQLQRNRVVINSSTTNPIVVGFDKELAAMRAAIISSIDNQIVTLQTRMKSISKRDQQASQRIMDNPKQAKELLSVSRQQTVMEAIYLYLLQKREENQLTQAFSAYNTRIINLPNGSSNPTSPSKSMILMIALMLGVAVPAAAIYFAESLITVVRGRKDLEGMNITFLGELPEVNAKKKSYRNVLVSKVKKLLPRGANSSEPVNYFVVKAKSRNMINEAFRIVRTNIEFVLKKESGCKVIMTTSLNPGSGKTFISLNLATSFAIKGSRVLIIDLDIRKATISSIVSSGETKGISNYLNHSENRLSSLIERGKYSPTLDILPVGTIPPNPTELLVDVRLGEAFEELRSQYDYIFVDCPPSEIVADVSIINDYVDMTLYIARVGHMERAMLKEIDKFYTEHKYKNISLILNGSGAMGGYGSYGYGYGNYGYGYGSTKGGDGYTVED